MCNCCCHCCQCSKPPKEQPLPAPEIQQQILAEYTNDNHAELAKKFGLSNRTIYRILKRHHQKGTQS